ncbi:MAG: UDP-N-acetylglucosamine 2-epimerase (non-hydrolyzing) [Bacteroidales bacterium]|nr:UDP-N-acetylglucosamine 2-epimerase (non-hydrolyzing) [Bacteroidales bacterium]
MTILTVVGARPQFVKAAIVSRAMKQFSNIKEVLVHTGQHFDTNMSDIFFEEMEIQKPTYNLNINGLNHGAMTGQMLEKIEAIIVEENPDWVLVYGDTNSTLAGALAAAKLHVKIAHVEAGLRSFNMAMPEEINRILTDRIATILFAPTDQAVANLNYERLISKSTLVVKTGDVMLDAAMFFRKKIKKLNNCKYKIITTVHRAENTDNPEKLQVIFNALEKVAEKYEMILPLHPRTKEKLEKMNYNFAKSHIHFVEPVSYLDMIALLMDCILVMTDSGGLQKEAYFLKKPCITLREETEWTELVSSQCNILSLGDYSNIIHSVEKMISLPESCFNQNLYGDGNAAKKIVETILNYPLTSNKI